MKSRINALLEELRELQTPIAWDICVNEFPAVCKNYPDGIPMYDADDFVKEIHPVEDLEKAILGVEERMMFYYEYAPRDLGPFFLGILAGYSALSELNEYVSLQGLTDVFMSTLSRRAIRELHSLNYLLLRKIVLWHLQEEALGKPVAPLNICKEGLGLYSRDLQWSLAILREAELLSVHCRSNGLILPRYIVRRDEKLGWVLECLDHEIPESLSSPGWIPQKIRRF